MKVVWVMNFVPPEIVGQFGAEKVFSGGWIRGMRDGVTKFHDPQIDLTLLFSITGRQIVTGRCEAGNYSYAGIPEGEIIDSASDFLLSLMPDVIHFWGAEFKTNLLFLYAADKAGLINKTVVSIQGLPSLIACHVADGLPRRVKYGRTFYDIIRKCSVSSLIRRYEKLGRIETEILSKAALVVGRTDWDYACAESLGLAGKYRKCNENLRESFYESYWSYEQCQKHSIFFSRGDWSVKGLHYMLEAMPDIIKFYPDAHLYVAGDDPTYKKSTVLRILKITAYGKYIASLIAKYNLENHITFLGYIDEETMKKNYLRANVFVLASLIENSPNSLGEAMILGVPCVAADIGGVSSMMTHGDEGYIYQSNAPYMLAYYVRKIFRDPESAGKMGRKAAQRAVITHDRDLNTQQMIAIYREIEKIAFKQI